jgi:hypothetical protein
VGRRPRTRVSAGVRQTVVRDCFLLRVCGWLVMVLRRYVAGRRLSSA